MIAGLWSRRSDSAVSLVPRATKAPNDPAFLIRQRWRSFRPVLTGTRRRKTPFSGWSRSMSNPASRSNSPRWVRRRTPSWPGGIRLHPDGNRLAVKVCPQARQDLHARRLRRIHILVRPTDAAIQASRERQWSGLSANRKLSFHTPRPKSGIYSSSGLLSPNLPLFSGHLQLPVALRVYLLLPPRQQILWRDVTNRAVQANVVVLPVYDPLRG